MVVKNTWIDYLRKYTKGIILCILNKANIEGVPIYDVQVTYKVYDKDSKLTTINYSTHCIWAAFE